MKKIKSVFIAGLLAFVMMFSVACKYTATPETWVEIVDNTVAEFAIDKQANVRIEAEVYVRSNLAVTDAARILLAVVTEGALPANFQLPSLDFKANVTINALNDKMSVEVKTQPIELGALAAILDTFVDADRGCYECEFFDSYDEHPCEEDCYICEWLEEEKANHTCPPPPPSWREQFGMSKTATAIPAQTMITYYEIRTVSNQRHLYVTTVEGAVVQRQRITNAPIPTNRRNILALAFDISVADMTEGINVLKNAEHFEFKRGRAEVTEKALGELHDFMFAGISPNEAEPMEAEEEPVADEEATNIIAEILGDMKLIRAITFNHSETIITGLEVEFVADVPDVEMEELGAFNLTDLITGNLRINLNTGINWGGGTDITIPAPTA